MKKISLVIVCAVSALLFASCQTGTREDANGNTPSSVVEKMYQAIQAKDFAMAASYNRIPDTVKIKLAEGGKIYEQFQSNPVENEKIIITSEEWKSFLIGKMETLSENYSLDSWEIVSEEISNTDPNSAKVKTKIHVTTQEGESDVECSFPLKRDNNIWLIIG